MKKIFNWDSKFSKILMLLVDLFLINLLFIVFSIPIFTIGASATALYTLTLRIIRGEHQYVLRSFYTAFKNNFKQATSIWLMIIFFSIVLYANILFIGNLSGFWYVIFFSFIIIFGIIFGSLLLLIFPVLARFKNSIKNTILNTLKLDLMNPHILVVLWIINFIPLLSILLSPVFFITAIYIMTFGGFAIVALINSFFIHRIFRKVES